MPKEIHREWLVSRRVTPCGLTGEYLGATIAVSTPTQKEIALADRALAPLRARLSVSLNQNTTDEVTDKQSKAGHARKWLPKFPALASESKL